MTHTIEEKFDILLDLVISTAEKWKPLVIKKRKELKRAKAIQIILTISTTILLGLKLDGIFTSIAFIISTIATAYAVWYNVDINNKSYISMYRYRTAPI